VGRVSTEIDDLYLILRATYAPMVEGFEATQAAGERMAESVLVASTEITTHVERMALAVKAELGVFDEATNQARYDIDRLRQATIQASIDMEAACWRSVRAVEKLDAATYKLKDTQGFKAARAGATAGAVAFDLFAVASIKMAGDFESSTVRLVTSAGEINSNLGTVRQGILQMAGDVGDSAEELARAMYTIESGGQHGADGLLVLRAAAEGAKAENADLTVVADAVTSVLQDYHLKASDAAMVTSKLVAAVGAGKTTFQELAASLSAVLPIASNAHISLEDVTGALASMTVHGMSASQASQNLADVIKHMGAPTDVMKKELGQLGVSSGDLSDMLGQKGITGTLQYLSETILSHMGPSGRVLLNAFNQSKDAARDANLMIAAMPARLQEMARGYQHGAISLADWRKELKGLPVDQANLLTQFAALQAHSSGFNDILKAGSPAAQTYQDALRRVTGDATGLNVALMLTGENTDYVNNAVRTVSGATAEAGGHVKGWSEIQATFNQRLSQAKASFGALAVEVGEKLLPPVSKFLGWLASGAEWLTKHRVIATGLAVAIGLLAVAFTIATIAMWAMSATPVFWIIAAIVVVVGLLVIGIYELVKHWHTVWGAIWGFMKMIGHWFASDFAGFFVMLWDKIWGFLKNVGHFFASAWRGAVDGVMSAVHWFERVPDMIGNAIRALPGRLEAVAKAGMHLFFRAIGFELGLAYDVFVRWPPKVGALLVRLFLDAVHIAHVGVDKVIGFFSWLGQESVRLVKEWWSETTSDIHHGVVAAVGFAADLYHGVVHWVEDTYHRAVAFVAHLIDDAVGFFHLLVTRGPEALHDLPGNIVKAVSDAGHWLYDAGRNVVHGFLDGLRSMWRSAVDTVKGWGHDIIQGFHDATGIGSPSKKFAEAGKNIILGLVQGINDHAHLAVGAMARLGGGLSLSPSVGVGGLSVARGGGLSLTARSGFAGSIGGVPTVNAAFDLYIDGKQVRDVNIKQSQRYKARNNSTGLT